MTTRSDTADERRFDHVQVLCHSRQGRHDRFGCFHAAGVPTSEYERRDFRSHERVPFDLTQPDVLVPRQNDPLLCAGNREPLDITHVVEKALLMTNDRQAA